MRIKKKIKKKKFFYFEKKISSIRIMKKLCCLGDKAIKPEEKLTRIYPQKNLFSHDVIGQIDDNNNGISGIEKSFDRSLKIKIL